MLDFYSKNLYIGKKKANLLEDSKTPPKYHVRA